MRVDVFIYDINNSIASKMLFDLTKIEGMNLIGLFDRKECKVKIVNTIFKLISRTMWTIRKRKYIKSVISGQLDFIVFTNESLVGFSKKDIKELKEKKIPLVGLLIDPVDSNYKTGNIAKQYIDSLDLILSFDPVDSKKYGFIYVNTLYSKVVNVICNYEPKLDLVYVGHLKGRKKIITQLDQQCSENDIKIKQEIVGIPDDMIESANITFHRAKISYDNLIKLECDSRCIFDITQEKQSGITLRYYEAVVYNRKLLTNNKNIIDLPFYNERYMKIYEDIEQIDWEWVKDKSLPDYHYSKEFSPINLLPIIDRFLNKCEEY